MIGYFSINNRRYLGNKFKLIQWIRRIVVETCGEVHSFFDVFSGTGSVASAFVDTRLVVNDILYSNYLAALCWFSPEKVDRDKMTKLIEYYNRIDASKEENYMSQNFSDTYFNREACKKIGLIREDIEQKFESGEVNKREHASIVTSLIYAMDRISHTCGHYDSFIRDGKNEGILQLRVPLNDYALNPNNRIYNTDSNQLADIVETDVAYLDPPYNSRQYCDAYHLLENVSLWQKPTVTGIAKKMDRSGLKSKYCGHQAPAVLEDIVNKLRCKHIVLSYNNSGVSLQDRSNARISDEDIIRILSNRGDIHVFKTNHKGFDAGLSNLNKNNQERLFVCHVRD